MPNCCCHCRCGCTCHWYIPPVQVWAPPPVIIYQPAPPPKPYRPWLNKLSLTR